MMASFNWANKLNWAGEEKSAGFWCISWLIWDIKRSSSPQVNECSSVSQCLVCLRCPCMQHTASSKPRSLQWATLTRQSQSPTQRGSMWVRPPGKLPNLTPKRIETMPRQQGSHLECNWGFITYLSREMLCLRRCGNNAAPVSLWPFDYQRYSILYISTLLHHQHIWYTNIHL